MITTIVEFYFDPVSPYAWLAMEQVDKLMSTGARLECRPILFAALLNAFGTKGPAEIPTKRAYAFCDVMRQAKRLGLPFLGPLNHPFNPLAALRVMWAVEEVQRLHLARRLFEAVWRRGVDIGDQSKLRAVLTAEGFDADTLCAACAAPAIKDRLRDATQQAIDAGIFGVPTFRLHNEIFWGADRIDTVLWALRGGTIDTALYQDVLARPAGARR